MQRHHRALAEAAEGEPGFVDPKLSKLLVEKRVDHRLGGLGALEAIIAGARVVDRPRGAQREPLPAHRRAGAALVRMRRDESRVGQDRAPMLAEFDQVVAVGAVAVQEHDELLGLAAFGLEAGSGQFGGHGGFLVGVRPV